MLNWTSDLIQCKILISTLWCVLCRWIQQVEMNWTHERIWINPYKYRELNAFCGKIIHIAEHHIMVEIKEESIASQSSSRTLEKVVDCYRFIANYSIMINTFSSFLHLNTKYYIIQTSIAKTQRRWKEQSYSRFTVTQS